MCWQTISAFEPFTFPERSRKCVGKMYHCARGEGWRAFFISGWTRPTGSARTPPASSERDLSSTMLATAIGADRLAGSNMEHAMPGPRGVYWSRYAGRPMPLSRGRGAAALPSGDFTASGGSMPAGASLTRAGQGSRFNSSSQLVYAGVDVPRFDHNPATGALLGLLIEPQRTNLLTDSEQVGPAAAWTLTRAATTADDGAAPDGALTADRLASTGANGFTRMTNPAGVAAGDQIAGSLFASPLLTADPLWSVIFGASMGVNWSAAAANSATGGYRRIVAAITATSASGIVQVTLASAGEEARLWGAQLEKIAAGERQEASSYIPTTTAQATRAADVLKLQGPSGTWRFTFDDLSTQDIALTADAGAVTVPTNLNRRHLRAYLALG